jgi:hypothetical protein
MTKITAKIRLKMAAPIRADVRTEASKKEWATYPTVIAMVDAQTATRKFMILDITRLCAPLRVNCAWCLAERAIYLLWFRANDLGNSAASGAGLCYQ